MTVLTTNIEATRLRAEAIPASVSIESFHWFDATIAEEIRRRSRGEVATDVPVPGCADVDPGAFRQPLTPHDLNRFRRLGSAVATGLEETCRRIDPEDTERAVAADLIGTLAREGIDAPVALVGGADRAQRFRHYTPTDARIGAYALVSVSARRNGAWISATRTVAFDPPAWLPAHHAAAMRVEASAITAARELAGAGTAGEVFEAIQRAYELVGFPDEWRHHHQGGATGFDGREWFAAPGHPAPIERPMAFAWNPTVQGAKSEDSVAITDEGVEILTETGSWPTTAVRAVGNDAVVPRHAILQRA